jgi:preprotein translocase SecE subunit
MSKDAAAKAKKDIVKQDENGKNKKPNKFSAFFKKIADGFRKLRSELKKVTWPDFKTVLKQTGVVLVVTLFFLVVIGCFDLGLNALLKLLIS